MRSAIAQHDPYVLQPAVGISLKTNRRMGWPGFVLYPLRYSRCLATLVGRIRTCDSDVIQTGSRFVYSLRRSYGADSFAELPTACWAVDRI
jgi:hypothetical protein